MQITHKVFAFFLLLYTSVELSQSTCTSHGEHGLYCSTMEDIRDLDNHKYIHILKLHPMMKEISSDTFSTFPNLTHLDLSEGSLKKIEPGAFSHLNYLLRLDLADNQIKHLKSSSFKGLHNLKSLNLRKNEIRQLSPELLTLTNLQLLDVVGNPLECNCATLSIRDALIKRNVKISRKTLCAGPVGLKGISLIKPETNLFCSLKKIDKEMQNDQPVNYDEEGSGVENSELYDDYENSEETTNKIEVETPEPSVKLSQSTSKSVDKTNSTSGDEIFFDFEENNKKTKKEKEHPEETEGSGNVDDEGSGLEGSGLDILPHINWQQIREETSEENVTSFGESSSTTHSESLFDMILNVLWTTAAPEEKKLPELEEEQFIHVTTSMTTTEEKVELKNNVNNESTQTNQNTKVFEPLKPKPTKETEKLMNSVEDQNTKLNESLSHESKKGMGSYVVLAVLLVVLAGLIAFAAYKGDFCRSKRKDRDVEDGTELKDMQKSLLEQNTVLPKGASNGNAEIVPLMSGKDEDRRISENGKREDITNGYDQIKPPRMSIHLGDEKNMTNGTNSHEQITRVDSGNHKPPVSPGAQRVKITLQDNPDSVPKTPLLITRLKSEDNLVKSP